MKGFRIGKNRLGNWQENQGAGEELLVSGSKFPGSKMSVWRKNFEIYFGPLERYQHIED